MNLGNVRQLAASAAVSLGVCAGGHVLLVDPAERTLAETRSAVADRQAKLKAAEAARDVLPQVTAGLARVRADAAAIAQRSRFARDEGELFAAVTALSEAHGVRVDQLDPIKTGQRQGRGGRERAEAAPGPRDITLAYNMTVLATYGDIVAFLHALRREMGYTRVSLVQITPTPDVSSKTVRAVIQTEHLAFDAAPVAAADPASVGVGG